MPRTRLLAALVALAAGGAGAPSEAGATTITVNAFEDVFADDGRCTLAEAVSAANTNLASGFAAGECAAGSALDVVSVPIGTFDISRELLVKTGVTVAGAGPLLTFVRQHVERRVLTTEGVVELRDLTITGGDGREGVDAALPSADSGGGVLGTYTTGTAQLTLVRCIVTGNRAGDGDGTFQQAGSGGGVATPGPNVPLTLVDTVVSDNRAGRGADAGDSSSGSGGDATGVSGYPGGEGGGISAGSTLTMQGGALLDNVAGAGGNGGDGTGGAGLDAAKGAGGAGGNGVGGGGGAGGNGGGAEVATAAVLDHVLIRGNATGIGGGGGTGRGGAGGSGGFSAITSGGAGGAGGTGAPGTGGSAGSGGGIGETAAIADSTITQNTVGRAGPAGDAFGGAGGAGGSSSQSTGGNGGAGGNAVTENVMGAPGTGTGLWITRSQPGQGLTQTTVSANLDAPAPTASSLLGGGGGKGGTGTASGTTGAHGTPLVPTAANIGVVGRSAVTVTATAFPLRRTIVAGNGAVQCQGTTTDGGSNLSFGPGAGPCFGIHLDPLLGPLQDNGGPTATLAPAPASPALDAVPAAACSGTDQRGIARLATAPCDIGAFEAVAPLGTTGATSAVTTTGASLAGTVDPRGRATYAFEYGPTTAYGNRSADTALTGVGATTVSVPVSGLSPGTTYHYRVVAGSPYGGAAGADATFTTSAAPAGTASPGTTTGTGTTTTPTATGTSATPRLGALTAFTVVPLQTTTKVVRIRVSALLGGERILVTCKGTGCPTKAKRVTGLAKAKGALVVAKALGGARLRKGTVLTVTVTKAGYVGRVTTATMRDRRRRPVIARRCLPPGAARPVACT